MLFSGVNIAKSKPFTTPSHKDLSNLNSKMKIKSAADENTQNLCNRSFDTAQNLINKSGPNMRQTKLCLRRIYDETENPSTSLKNKSATGQVEFFLMPQPIVKSTNPKGSALELPSGSNQTNDENKKPSTGPDGNHRASSLMNKKECNKLVIMGKVDFCLKMHKLYPDLYVLWDVYGKVVKTIVGENRGEHILILRSPNNLGPVIQSIYYDFNDILKQFPPGTSLRAVGEFTNVNRLRTFRLQQFDCESYEAELSRIQSVISFSLLQRNT